VPAQHDLRQPAMRGSKRPFSDYAWASTSPATGRSSRTTSKRVPRASATRRRPCSPQDFFSPLTCPPRCRLTSRWISSRRYQRFMGGP
jgi:hypothetical protein